MFLYVYPFKVLLYIYIYFHPKSSNWFCLLPNPIYLEFCEYDIDWIYIKQAQLCSIDYICMHDLSNIDLIEYL